MSGGASRASRGGRGPANGIDESYDLLTAALLGATVGASLTFLLRRGPSGRRPATPLAVGVGRGAAWAGRHAAHLAARGGRWGADRGEAAWGKVPHAALREHVSAYVGHAREAIDDVVESELHDLRRAIRRRRKRLGL